MTIRAVIARVMLLAVAGSLSSCLDVREEYWFDGSGGGRADLSYAIPAVAARLYGGESGIRHMIDGFLAETPAITAASYQVVTEGSSLQVRLQCGISSAGALEKLANGAVLKHFPSAASCLLGSVHCDLHGTTVDFRREIFPAKAMPQAALLPSSRLAGHRLTYIMHLPVAAGESNATTRLDGGRTLVWDTPLEQALQGPVVTRFKARMPWPWSMLLAGGLALVSVVGLLLAIVHKVRRRRLSTKS